MGKFIIVQSETENELNTQIDGMTLQEAMFACCVFAVATAKDIGMTEQELNVLMNDLWTDGKIEHS